MSLRSFNSPHFILILAGIALFCGVIAFAPADIGPTKASASKAGSHTKRVVTSPRPGRVFRSNHVRLRVRAKSLADVLTVRLNGVRVDQDFARPRRGVRTLKVTVSHGLRRGRNLLKVKVQHRGRAARRATVRFFVRRRRPLIGAGRDRRIAVGSKALLVGRVRHARHRGGKVKHARHRGGRSRLRWRIVKGPRTKRGAVSPKPGRKASARLTSRVGSRVGFKPRVRGRYILELRHRAGKRRTADRVKLDVVPTSPMVPIQTIPTDHSQGYGVIVGSQRYKFNDPKQFVQMLVLDRKTLGLVTNDSYSSADEIRKKLSTLDDSNLVIVTRTGEATDGFGGFGNSLNHIGVPDLKLSDFGNHHATSQPGEFSAIGVPGMKPGSADYRLNVRDQRDPYEGGNLRGYLTPDQYRNYSYVASDRRAFKYGGSEVSPCPDGVTSCGDSHIGFRLSVLDAHTLLPRPDDGAIFDTHGRGMKTDQVTGQAENMIATLNRVAPDDIVIIQTVSNRQPGEGQYPSPIATGTLQDYVIHRETMSKLAAAVASVGGTRNTFNRAVTRPGAPASGGATYTLIGRGGAGEGEGEEIGAGVDGAGDAPVLSGVLSPDRSSKFRPTQVANSVDDPAVLSELTLQKPTSDWPLDNDPGAQRAIAYLGSQDSALGPDPRSAYWTEELDTDALIQKLNGVPYPPGKNFTQAQFQAAQAELVKELGWVGKVRRYLARLSTPFADNALPSWAASKNIADRVYADANPNAGEVSINWLEIAEALLDMIPVVGPEAAGATEAVSAAAEFGVRVYGATDGSGEPTDREVNVEADQLGAELLAQAQQAQATFLSMGDVIVSDYSKLSALGPYAGCNSRDSACPKQFAFSEADRIAASASLYRGIEAIAYTKLLPLGYYIFHLKLPDVYRDDHQSGQARPRWGPPDPKGYNCNLSYPWSRYPDIDRSSASLLLVRDPWSDLNQWDVYVLSRPSRSDLHGSPPSEELLQRMFGPISKSGDPKAGGLAVSWPRLILDSQTYRWMGSDSHENFSCDWND